MLLLEDITKHANRGKSLTTTFAGGPSKALGDIWQLTRKGGELLSDGDSSLQLHDGGLEISIFSFHSGIISKATNTDRRFSSNRTRPNGHDEVHAETSESITLGKTTVDMERTTKAISGFQEFLSTTDSREPGITEVSRQTTRGKKAMKNLVRDPIKGFG